MRSIDDNPVECERSEEIDKRHQVDRNRTIDETCIECTLLQQRSISERMNQPFLCSLSPAIECQSLWNLSSNYTASAYFIQLNCTHRRISFEMHFVRLFGACDFLSLSLSLSHFSHAIRRTTCEPLYCTASYFILHALTRRAIKLFRFRF